MRAKSQKLVGVILMILLLTAQTMGWCRAYVCDCFGTPEVTLLDHCHGPLGDSHDHGDASEPCSHDCGGHCDHSLLGSHDAFAPARVQTINQWPATSAPVLTLPSSIENAFIVSRKTASRPLQAVPKRPPSCLPRLTVALLI